MGLFRKEVEMKKLLIIGMLALISSGLLSCSDPAGKAKKIEDSLTEKEGVVYKNLEGDNPQIITYSVNPDSTTVVLVHNLRTNSKDTLSQLPNGLTVSEVVPIEDGYLYMIRQERSDGKDHYLYQGIIKRNIDNPKEKSKTILNVKDSKEELWASGYVIDKEKKKIILNSYEVAPEFVDIYHTVYDFKGNKIVEDPVHINIPKPQTYTASESSASYLWQCDDCGKRVNSGKKPSSLSLDGCWHQWVNLGRVS